MFSMKLLTVGWQVDAHVHREEVVALALAAVLGCELGRWDHDLLAVLVSGLIVWDLLSVHWV